jgi:hypothetical protein
MSMLIRAGLPSRLAAIAAIRKMNAVFVTVSYLREWLASEEIAALTDGGHFPTPETSVLWRRFRDDLLSVTQQKWSVGRAMRAFSVGVDGEKLSEGTYRIEFEFDAAPGDAWLTTPDCRRVAKLNTLAQSSCCGLLTARVKKGSSEAQVERFGPGLVWWLK